MVDEISFPRLYAPETLLSFVQPLHLPIEIASVYAGKIMAERVGFEPLNPQWNV